MKSELAGIYTLQFLLASLINRSDHHSKRYSDNYLLNYSMESSYLDFKWFFGFEIDLKMLKLTRNKANPARYV